MPPDTRRTAKVGRDLVADRISARGFLVREATIARRPTLLVERDGVRRRVRVSTRRRGDWQTSTAYGAEVPSSELRARLWVFVDLTTAEPEFYLVPEAWMAVDIYQAHQDYLARHDGHRKVTDGSTHHAIPLWRIAQWQDRWDLLELEDRQ